MLHPTKLTEHQTKVYSYENGFKSKSDFALVSSYYHTDEMGFPIGMHSHTFYEINIIASGSAYHYIGQQQCLEAEVGDVFVIPPYVKHGYYTSNDKDLKIFHILLNCEFIERYKNELNTLPGYTVLFETEPFIRPTSQEKFFLSLSPRQFEKVHADIDELVSYETSDYSGNEIQKITKTLYLIGQFCQFIFLSHKKYATPALRTESFAVVQTIEYMRSAFYDKISIDKLAKIANMSRSTYLRYFKQLCNCTPSEYLTELRIAKSAEMLLGTDKSISEISQDCGFFDSSHFSRFFSNIKGMTPLEFRRHGRDLAEQDT